MTQYLLHTDIFIYLLKHDPSVERKVHAVGDGVNAVSAVTVAEVMHGAYFSAMSSKSLLESRALLARLVVIALDTPLADTFGNIKAELRRLGQVLADFDLLLGITAIVHGRTFVTHNKQHFQRLASYGLLLEDWKS